MTTGDVPGSLYGLSHNGWISWELFYHWFASHFLEYIPKVRPVILMLDGHSSHYAPATIKLAAANGVIVSALPPHTTHITQPLDRACFAPLKLAWRQACHDFCTKYPGRTVTRYDFNQLFSNAWYDAMTPGNIIASFKATGICPLDRSALIQKPPSNVDKPFTSFKPENLAQRTGIAHIPLYSPARSSSPD